MFKDGFEDLLGLVANALPSGSETERRAEALSVLAEMIGALVLARSVGDGVLSKEILDLTKRRLLVAAPTHSGADS
jgi:TetR/AcrR family transcriptional repressor of nem operon